MLPTRYSEILASDLIREYAAECSISAIGVPDPQPAIYEQMENCGLMRCFGVYRDARLVGFGTPLVSILPHYGLKAATVESVFVAASERRSMASGRLLHAIENHSRSSECEALIYSAPTGSEFEAFLSGREEYARTNSVFCRRLA